MSTALSSGNEPLGAVVVAGFVLLAVFQVALALGAPWGRAAWGGAHVRLPRGLRIASAFSAAFWLLAALVILARAGYDWSPIPLSIAEWGTWVLVGMLVLGTLMNLASRSKVERAVQTPSAAILAVLTFLVARA